MQRIFGKAVLLLLAQPMFAALAHVPTIGDKLRSSDIPKSVNHNVCAVHTSQSYPCFDQRIDGVRYTIAFDDSDHRVTYIATHDTGFKTIDGYKVGDEIVFPRSQLHVVPAWEIYGPTTRDGWRPIVGIDLGPLVPDKNSPTIDLRGNTGTGDPIKTRITGFSKGKY